MKTVSQDPAGRYTILIEEWRRRAGERGTGPVVSLLYDLITCILMLCASRAEQIRIDKLAETAPACAEDAAPRLEGGQIPPLIQSAACAGARRAAAADRLPAALDIRDPVVARPTTLAVAAAGPGDARRRGTIAGPAPARPLHAHLGAGPRWRGSGLVWTTNARLLRPVRENGVEAARFSRAYIVTISQRYGPPARSTANRHRPLPSALSWPR
jgi:hypothetical protein